MFGRKPLVWPFVFLVIGICLFLFFLFWGKGEFVRAPIEPMPGCVIVNNHGDSESKIDIVFLGANYVDVSKFIEDTYEWSTSLMEVEPYKRYNEAFNFFRIENFEDYGCEWDEGYIICDTGKIIRASAICPHDYFIVLTDTRGEFRLSDWLRSSYYQKVIAINTADDKLVLAHEAGHAFGDFAEEYTEEGLKIWWDAPNCDSDMEKCLKFENVENSECIPGCTNFEHSRSTREGIMRDYWIANGKTYGNFNEYVLEQFLLEITNFVSDESPTPEPVLIVDIECEDENCSIEAVEEIIGFPDGDNNKVHDDSPMKLVTSDENDNKIISKMEDMPKIFTCNKDSRTVNIKKPDEYVLILPYPDKDSKEIKFELVDGSGDIIDSKDYVILNNNEMHEENLLNPSSSGNSVVVGIGEVS